MMINKNDNFKAILFRILVFSIKLFWVIYNLASSITKHFYKAPRTDKCHALAFQIINLFQLSSICQS
jgi:hypothetical protein